MKKSAGDAAAFDARVLQLETPDYTLEDYRREKSKLAVEFFLRHGLKSNEIEHAIMTGRVPGADDLATRWVAMESMYSYMETN